MKKLLMVLIVLILMFAKPVFSVNAVSLEGFSRPSILLVNFNRVYILEQTSVYIYSLKDFKLIKKFGKAGEGPREFKVNRANGKPLSMCFYKNQLLINSDHKASYFDLDGNFIREEKVKVDRLLFPIGEKFLGIGLLPGKDKKQYLGFSLHNNKYTSKKNLFLSDIEITNPQKLLLPISSFTYNPVYKKRIYINANSNDFQINVYNNDGKQEYVIEKNYPKLKIPNSFRKEALTFFKTSPMFKRSFEYFKKIIKIKKNFPPIRDLQIIDGFIYIITFKQKGNLWECIKMDLKGNEKGRNFIKLNAFEHFTFYPLLYSVYKGNVYTLVEDEKDEIWKIHVSKF